MLSVHIFNFILVLLIIYNIFNIWSVSWMWTYLIYGSVYKIIMLAENSVTNWTLQSQVPCYYSGKLANLYQNNFCKFLNMMVAWLPYKLNCIFFPEKKMNS